MEAANFEALCPQCKVQCQYDAASQHFLCQKCFEHYPVINNNIVSFLPELDSDKGFYEHLYGNKWKPRGLTVSLWNAALRPFIARLSIAARRERFFRKHLRKGDYLILDLACGYGRELFASYGKVIGLDIVLAPLHQASKLYMFCVHADASNTPFEDNYFDYIVSSDFLGHIPLDQKDALYGEMHRILKMNGKMLHVLETDSTNWHFRFAHRYPQLFRKYFVEEIGGHFGLEMPHQAVKRFENNGFRLIDVKKIWGDIWQVGEYKIRFDNEYKDKSKLIKGCVYLSRLLTVRGVVAEASNILLNPLAALIERFTPLDNGQGLCVFCEKT